jgi:hypothetical protein
MRTVVVCVILVIGMVIAGRFAVRYFVRARALGHVDSAIGTMSTLAVEESRFAKTHPTLGYTCVLADLTTDPTIASGKRNGYVLEISGCRSEEAPNTTYHMSGRPLRPGMPAFCSDQSRILKADYDGSTINCLKSGQPLY